MSGSAEGGTETCQPAGPLTGMDSRMVNWLAWLMEFVAARAELPTDRLLAVFDGLHELFSRPDFGGCPLINAVAVSSDCPGVIDSARSQRGEFREFVRDLAEQAGIPDARQLAEAWTLLVDGAFVAAQRLQAPAPAQLARSAAEQLLSTHLHR
ncbi:MAG: hypothetical protein QOJ19_5013 [Acidimicrobiia bacterium]|nr:hypothetical protein [Acidimicrobiia bacterium]